MDGVFRKELLPVSTSNGDSSPKVGHAQRLYDAVQDALSNGLKCRLILQKGTRNGITPGGVRAAVDGDNWMVKELSGDVASGFAFVLERIE